MIYLVCIDDDNTTNTRIVHPDNNVVITQTKALEIIKNLIDFYCTNSEDDLIEQNRLSAQETTVNDKKKLKDSAGFVYVFECDNTYKIGFTKNVERRYRELSKMSGHEYRVIITKYFINARTVEQFLHKKYEKNKINNKNEWFKFSELEIETLVVFMNQVGKEFLSDE